MTYLAEEEGFEPPVPFRVQRFSRPPPSTTRPPLRAPRGSLNVTTARGVRPRSAPLSTLSRATIDHSCRVTLAVPPDTSTSSRGEQMSPWFPHPLPWYRS